eukprot:2599578-Pyramimonas_sp.AAC.1
MAASGGLGGPRESPRRRKEEGPSLLIYALPFSPHHTPALEPQEIAVFQMVQILAVDVPGHEQ